MKFFKVVPYYTVEDLDKEIDFYCKVLGYEVMGSLEDDKGIYWADRRNDKDDIMLSNRLVYDRPRLTWLYVEDVDAAYQEVVKRGGKPLYKPQDTEHQTREFLIEDASGNTLVISQHTP